MTVVDISTKTVVCPKSSKRLFMLQDLDTTDSAILKALAITAIALHNFFHLITPVRQNEFSFSAARFTVFLNSVQHPTMAVQAFFAFFGHYGVQVFVFLSAYGLARTHWDQDESWATFMWGRIRKLYPIFLVIVGGWAIGEAVLLGPLLFIKQMGLHLLLMLLGVSTLFGFSLPPIGPWWFIPFIIQFYAIWPLLRKLTHRYGWRLLLALSVLSMTLTAFANPLLRHWSLNLLYTPIGRLPVLCLGIAAARYPLRIRSSVAAVALALVLLGSHYAILWPLTLPSAAIVALWAYVEVRDSLRTFAWLRRLGEYSLLVFLLNGIVRNHSWLFVHSPWLQLLFGCTSVALSFAIAAAIHESLVSRPQAAKIPAKKRRPAAAVPTPDLPRAVGLPLGASISRASVQPVGAD